MGLAKFAPIKITKLKAAIEYFSILDFILVSLSIDITDVAGNV
jgi:hypothetical protein